MKYAEFEKKVVDTFNRMHYVDGCDDEFMIDGAIHDVQSILSKSFRYIFRIDYSAHDGYTVERDELTHLYDIEDDYLLEALQSFNDIMNRYNVVASTTTEYSLHII